LKLKLINKKGECCVSSTVALFQIHAEKKVPQVLESLRVLVSVKDTIF